MGESLQAMQRLWQALAAVPSPDTFKAVLTPPGVLAPTLDVAELDKRIADLRAVEQWLALNANMLRATIQTLEVQRNTIATLKSFSGTLFAPAQASPSPAPAGAPMQDAAAAAAPHAAQPACGSTAASGSAAVDPSAWWNALQQQFARLAEAAVGAPVSEAPKTRRPRRRAARPERR
ncbi:MAG: hypothetical protein N2483_06295 [Burkholderiaceae bacterium]|nr:hypothetical protein [Burkholderiaceae bacterium]